MGNQREQKSLVFPDFKNTESIIRSISPVMWSVPSFQYTEQKSHSMQLGLETALTKALKRHQSESEMFPERQSAKRVRQGGMDEWLTPAPTPIEYDVMGLQLQLELQSKTQFATFEDPSKLYEDAEDYMYEGYRDVLFNSQIQNRNEANAASNNTTGNDNYDHIDINRNAYQQLTPSNSPHASSANKNNFHFMYNGEADVDMTA